MKTTQEAIIVPIALLLPIIVVVDVMLLRFGFEIVHRLQSTPATSDQSRVRMDTIIHRILTGALSIFTLVQLLLVTGIVGVAHLLFGKGMFIYEKNESSYKLLIYVILWEFELMATVIMIAWVVKVRPNEEMKSSSSCTSARDKSHFFDYLKSEPLLESELRGGGGGGAAASQVHSALPESYTSRDGMRRASCDSISSEMQVFRHAASEGTTSENYSSSLPGSYASSKKTASSQVFQHATTSETTTSTNFASSLPSAYSSLPLHGYMDAGRGPS
jgi:hypothetical protein